MIKSLAALGAFDIAVIVLISVAVAAVIGRIIYKKVTGKGTGCCDCGCGCGGNCAHCKSAQAENPDTAEK